MKDAGFKAANLLHRTVFDVTKGWLGGKGKGMPVLKLTTTGRKSGQPRDTMLTSPVQDGNRLVLVASKGGDDRHPLWYLNLQAEPKVTVSMGGRVWPMVARTAGAEEKTELWPAIVSANPGYAGYQQKTDRDIPVVILEPAAGA